MKRVRAVGGSTRPLRPAGLHARSPSASLDGVRRIGMIVTSTLLVASVALTGCSKPAATGNPGPSGPSGSTPSAGSDGRAGGPSPAVSATPSDAFEFTVDGAGPYQFEETLTSLRSAGLDQISAGAAPCPSNTTARGTGKWKDLTLSFHADGTLYMVTN